MAQRRLTDSELATRVRASNVRRAERRRERLATAGYVQTVVWLSQVTRSALDTTAAERHATISETAERLLTAGLNATAPVSPAPLPTPAPAPSPLPVETMLERFGEPAPPATLTVDATPTPKPTAAELTPDMFEKPTTPAPAVPPVTTDEDALMTEIGAMFKQGLTGAEIARRLNSSGRRTHRGAEFKSSNLLRDYRAWCEKTGTVDATKEPT